jgi:hypothetical protein
MSAQAQLLQALPHRRAGTLRERVRARWAGPELDRRLAEGADPDGEPLLQLRAARLRAPASRAELAAGLELVVASVEKPKSPLSAAVPVRRGPVRGARRELMALADDLRHMPGPLPRGVAMAERLITDPCSPLYTAASSDEVERAVHVAASCLRGDPVL